jgi:hypothetical protein
VEGVLTLAGVLEEEYAALHPENAPPDITPRAGFTSRDIADLTGFARALLDSSAGAVVLRDQRLLRGLLRAPLVRASDAARARELLAERLTELLSADLEREPAFAAVRRTSRADDEGMAARPLRQRNRALLETVFAPYLVTTEDHRLASIVGRIHSARHAALCLSGGGIRSASFAMGVVQGLARRGLLSRFEYLSTVSGGGYTGSWLSAWMARSGAHRVLDQLRHTHSAKLGTEPAPIRHIRTYSAFLNPSLGLLSADTWTLLATIARNILLVWLVTVPVIAAALMLPRLLVAGLMMTLRAWNDAGIDPADLIVLLLVVGTVLAIGAISFVDRHLYTYSGRARGAAGDLDRESVQRFISRCLVPLVVAMAALAQAWEMVWSLVRHVPGRLQDTAGTLTQRAWARALIDLDPTTFNTEWSAIAMGIEFWVFVYVAAWAISARGRRYRLEAALLSALTGILAGAIGGFASARLFGLTVWHYEPKFYATFAVPVSLFGLGVSKQLVVGLASHRMTDAERESNARFSAWLLIAIVAWIAIAGLALYGPPLLHETIHLRGLITLSGVTGFATAVLAASSRRSVPGGSPHANARDTSKVGKIVQQTAIALATPLFAATVIMLISLADAKLLEASCRAFPGWCLAVDSGNLTDLFRGGPLSRTPADNALPGLVLYMLVVVLLLGYALGRLIDTNRFSLHAMYRMRLVRTFLGASRPPGARKPNPFTGFDETDDMPMGDLWPAWRNEPGKAPPPAASAALHPPLHVVNLTLNMVAGTDLATQSRKATSFTVTSLHAGSAKVGYRRTSTPNGASERLYGGPDGISLGTAMAISGAAASPNAGYHSSPAVTFLMTLFNARLGWWLGNPGVAGRKSYVDDEPRLALLPILEEMFGRTTDHSPYVHLSDGGHFENLGLYEMVRRRCHLIVVSDAGCDPDAAFDDLGGAIRKIRIDLGIPIEFDSRIPIYARDAESRPSDARCWAVGRIRYSCVDGDGARDGVVLYIKPVFYGHDGGEPCDVYNYATSRPDFPHESTGNQFFGEAQFESYRALGAYAVERMCESEFGVPASSDEIISADHLNEWLTPALRQP